MTQVVATTPGLFPLPDWAKDELSRLKGHQKSDLVSGEEGPEIVDAYDRAREEVVGVQTDAGLDRVTEGQLRWDDMIAHPLAVADNVETRGIVRYYNNNNFYREPVVTGDLEASGDVAGELDATAEHVDAGLQAVLPGPYSLADLATDEHYGDEAAFLDAVADFLAAEADQFPDVETLFLLEPSLVENAPGEGADERASEAIDTVASAVDADVVAHTYWGALDEKVYAHLMDAAVDAIGFDLIADHEQNVYNVQEYGTKDDVALGLVDGQNTFVETPETIRERVEWFVEQTDGDYDTVYATANTELFYLPQNKFEAKIEALADAAAIEEVEA
ncbi:5-methyltetrahydropteroyltriglutamate--homocysteine methyltransferase [Halomicrobium mukohataei]|uniref:5-methyltetrahydropteroyltriglutamate--homocysteine methyltransferase n=1 Tax=Halomicrobium mukohataei TaxID=57705 RepID=A0A847UC45_9EURY|nr:5-methyltetrahydropteroyltriglutamate--homocysteine methyltransferase [Halomicrobium mukohataei]NLV10995.1 5-methyltetrahydropteroyltriglutamate--homocysteine methyltransferase [Halomicrobium mukohataei]